MRVIVCGAGEVGFNIARHLSAEGVEVTVIDHSQDRIRKVSDGLDVQAVHGYASHPDILDQAGAGDVDMLIAVTQSDEINMIACQVGHSLFNVPIKIARVRHQAYLLPAWADLFSRENMPIDVLISPEAEVVSSVANRLEVPGALDMRSFSDDKVRLVGVRLDDGCPVINTPLKQLAEIFPDLAVTVVYVVRGDKAYVPRSMDEMLPGDEVYFVVATEQIARAMAVFGHEEEEARRLVIVGGGHIGLSLAAHLEQAAETPNIKLIELDKECAEHAADRLEKTVVLHGDALDAEILEEANISMADTIVAVTDTDEVNILASVLAKRHGCVRAVTLINASTYRPLISPLGIDASVSPREITVSSILEHVRRGRIRSVYSIRGGEAEVIEAEALATSPLVGTAIRDTRVPTGIIFGAIVRGDDVLLPRGDTVFKEGDRVILLAAHDAVKKVEKMFAVALGFF